MIAPAHPTSQPLAATPLTTNRLLAAAAPDLPTHLDRVGRLPQSGGAQGLVALLEQAGLTGRGGAGFPSARKLAAVAGTRRALAVGRRPIVVANGAEGEPLSSKDRHLLIHAPHLVLDGLQLVAAAALAKEAYVYVPEELRRRVQAAVDERHGVDRIRVNLVSAPDAFLSGQETSVLSVLSGGGALPRDTARPIVFGELGRPALVHNVETLAHLALLSRWGPGWFREVGTAAEPGTFLATIGGGVRHPGVYEFPHGVALAKALEAAGGTSTSISAVLVGGYHGAWLPWPGAADTPISRAGLQPLGASPGAGIIAALPAATCGLVQTSRILSYLAEQSAGQCGPCLNGLPRLAEVFAELAGENGRRATANGHREVLRLSGLVEGRGACHHPDGTVRLARSALRAFAADIDAHRQGRCTARKIAA